MVKVKPFKGFLANKALAPKIISPPYDVMSSAEARVMAQGNPHSFLHVNKPEIDLPPSLDPYDPQVYQQGKRNLQSFISNNWLVSDVSKRFYLYSQAFEG
jgi:uncharacterized protein (DUF1015 family)